MISSNFGLILHRFWDTAEKWKVRVFHTPLLFDAPAAYVPFEISRQG